MTKTEAANRYAALARRRTELLLQSSPEQEVRVILHMQEHNSSGHHRLPGRKDHPAHAGI